MDAAAASDRLSDLSDDVLIYVLSFLPSKEAARTTALSRRWRRPLWLDTGAVNLDSRSGGAFPASDADHAISLQKSHGRVPSKVTIVMHDCSMHEDVLRAACRDEAAVEELRLDCKDGAWRWPSCSTQYCKGCPDSEMYAMPPDSLPFAALRVLDLNGCRLMGTKQPQRSVAFPRLAVLRLRLCAMEIATLEYMVSAAPVLANLGLESLSFTDPWPYDRHIRLGCPAATVVAITNMAARESDRCTVEIDAPRLRRFHYTQHVWFGAFGEVTFNFKSPPPPGLERVDVQLRSAMAPLRSVLGASECHARVLKLTVFSIADVVVDREWNRYIYGGIVPKFPNLERLEIKELCGCLDDRATAGSATQHMLRRCPAIRELQLNFTYLDGTSVDPADYAVAMSELTPCKSSLDDHSDDGGGCCVVPYFPRMSKDCWRYSLKKVVVRSDVEELTCFQVQLIRFLARNAESLLEVDIVAGRKRYELGCLKVERWRAGPSTRSYFYSCQRLGPSSPPPLSWFPPLPDLNALRLDAEYAKTNGN